MSFRIASAALVLAMLFSLATSKSAPAITLIGDPFVSPYSGWLDPDRTLGGNWRLNLHVPTPTLMDTHNSNPSAIVSPPNNTGTHLPHLLVQDGVTTGANYEYTATMRTNDDDLLGIVFNYQDPNNYFRAGIRQQPSSGTFGGTQGFSVQKVVGGVITQLFPAAPAATTSPITQAMIDGRTPFDLKVAVTGNSFNVFFNGVSQLTGGNPLVDNDLATGRKIGFQTWAQQADAAAVTPFWGTEVNSVALTDGASTVYSQDFGGPLAVKWRNLVMKNGNNISMPSLGVPVSASTTASREDMGNFGLDINDRWIMQHSNGFESATSAAGGNVDFISPAIVVDDPGSASLSDYEMRVRIAADDNDGMGVLVRVQDDNNFYRVNFANQAIGTGVTRCPQGLSVQKVLNGVWSELFRDDQIMPAFVPAVGIEPGSQDPADWPFSAGLQDINGNPLFFDLSVTCVANAMLIKVTDHLGTEHVYPLILDNSSPLLTGTVGFTTWGTAATYYMNYGGVDGAPLLVDAVPEPATVALVIIATVGMFSMRRRFAKA